MKIKIDRNISLDDLNTYYGQLERFAEVEATVDVLLPKTLDHHFMGLVPALYQFVFTWIRYPHAGKLLLDIEPSRQEDLKELFENEHLFTLVMLAWSTTGIFNADGRTDIRPLLQEPVAAVRDRMLKVKPLKGRKILLVSIDHFPPASGLIPCYETSTGFIDNETNTFRNLKPALDEILNYSIEVKNAFDKYERDFVAIIHELIKNTYEWGRTDNDNVSLDPGVRGVLVKFYKNKRATFVNEFSMHKGLREYFESETLKENATQELYFIEISVFDCGIGFFDKYESPDKKSLNEIQVIKRCLIRHMTSARGLERDDKGIGLDRIMNLLDNKGFLRIKTHQSCLYRNLISHPYKFVNKEKDLELFDWDKQSNTRYTTLPRAAGSTLTILYPLALNPLV